MWRASFLLQRFNAVEVLSVPHFDQFLLVCFGPFSDELPAPLGDMTFNDVQILQFHHRQMLAVLDMDVPRWMLLVYEEHPDDDSVETANFGHAAVVSSACDRHVSRLAGVSPAMALGAGNM